MLERQHQKEIERAVIEMLQDYDLAKYPISVGAAAEALDVKVVPYSSLDSHIRNVAFAVSSDAFTIADAEYNSTTLAVNDVSGSNYNRARFSGAHELAHIFLGHSEESPFKEEEADYFAGYLLAPHPLILMLPKDAAVAERFGVSGQCASFAIDQANSRRKESSFWEPHEQWLVNNAVWRGGRSYWTCLIKTAAPAPTEAAELESARTRVAAFSIGFIVSVMPIFLSNSAQV